MIFWVVTYVSWLDSIMGFISNCIVWFKKYDIGCIYIGFVVLCNIMS